MTSARGRRAGGADPVSVPGRLGRMSLRARLLLITSVLLAAGLALGGSIVIGLLRANLVDRVDRQLHALAGLAAILPAGLPAGLPGAGTGQDGAGALGGRALAAGFDLITEIYVADLAGDGTVRSGTRIPGGPAAGGPVLPVLDTAAVARYGRRAFEAGGLDGTGRWRVIAMPRPAARTPGGAAPPGDGAIVVAASLDAVSATVGRLRAAFFVTGAALLALLTLCGWFAIRAGLRPLRRIEDTAAAIASGDLTRRVPDAAGPATEIGRLSASLNGMLAQIERAFAARADSEARLRRFVADVGHELRTPLFGIKGFSELYRMGGLSDVGPAMARIESESGRLAGLVDDLMLLARLDEGGEALPLDLAPMDLRTLAADARLDLRALAPDRPVELTGPAGGTPASAPVLGDESRLRQVVSNLVGNVVAHTPAGTRVRVGVGTAGAEAVLVIEDDGPGLTPEQAARAFDRFYRADASRSRSGSGGVGLGLAIAQSLAAAHGGRVTLRTTPGHGATFTLVLPLAR
ncbi:two-component sensor histidine kinase [Sphaerisporangium melleum]|uniref:histidine kinase n=1 Tax=Sphaerisporangium melleum TaxID=321316 RepID=A0A917VLP0_9ACTN|nr:HAMP domain-containing sensor histidine kinase [Sphaerisporangium melleum]GGK93568.1 two-component sensor histidine kinase [Sphaerisporangium melleum]GII73397.1 two-component sensor histidine kinase [Sphaerisporangium melleum]